MNRFSLFTVVMLSAFGLWGCSRTPTATISPERVQSLEANLRAANETQERLASKLRTTEAKSVTLEREIERLQGLLGDTTRERDEALAALRIRTAERDLSQTQYDGFRKSLKEMLGQADSAQANQKVDGALLASPMLPELPRQN